MKITIDDFAGVVEVLYNVAFNNVCTDRDAFVLGELLEKFHPGLCGTTKKKPFCEQKAEILEIIDSGSWQNSRHLPKTDSGGIDWLSNETAEEIMGILRQKLMAAENRIRAIRAIDLRDAQEQIKKAKEKEEGGCNE